MYFVKKTETFQSFLYEKNKNYTQDYIIKIDTKFDTKFYRKMLIFSVI